MKAVTMKLVLVDGKVATSRNDMVLKKSVDYPGTFLQDAKYLCISTLLDAHKTFECLNF